MFFFRTASLFWTAYAILDRLRYSGSLTLFWTASLFRIAYAPPVSN